MTKNYHYTETRQRWLKQNKFKLNSYMREYMRVKRNQNKNNIVIQNEPTVITFN